MAVYMSKPNQVSSKLDNWSSIETIVSYLHQIRSKSKCFTTKLFLFLIIFMFICVEVNCDSNTIYTNDFAVNLKPHKCHQKSAQSLADRHGFELVGQVFN